MQTLSLLERIAEIHDFTSGERTLARYFEREHASLHLETIESLSTKTGVSKSSVSRFVTRLGYPNFRTFLRDIWQDGNVDVETPIARYGGRNWKKASSEALLRDHLEASEENIRNTLKMLRPEAFVQALDLLYDENRRLYILGCSASGHLLGYFGVLMHYMRRNFVLLTGNAADMAREVAQPEEGAVLFAMTYKRYTNATDTMIRFFHERGHETIVLTDSYSAPCMPYATVPLVVVCGGATMFNTRCSALAVMEALIVGMSARIESHEPGRCDAVGDLFRRLNVYST